MLLAGSLLLAPLDIASRGSDRKPSLSRVQQCSAAPVPVPRRAQTRQHIAACRAMGYFRNGGQGEGAEDFDLRDFVTASVDGGEISCMV